MYVKKIKNETILLKILYLFLFLIYINQNIKKMINSNLKRPNNFSYETSKFAIIRRTNCPICGLFSFYLVHLGCINKYLAMGYIPIIDVMTFPNVFNGFNISKKNYWEDFFNQPFGYTLEEIKKRAKIIEYVECTGSEKRPSTINIYFNEILLYFWHDIQKRYMPIKKEILKESYIIMKKLFKGSKNILGVKMRGTDYLSTKPKGHPIPPNIEMVIVDVKNLYIKNKYDWIFMSTEDEILKGKFINEFDNKIKLFEPKEKINYDYKSSNNIMLNKDINGNLEYARNYLINMIILSKCIDIVSAKGSGAAGIFILTNGFRYSFVYNIGEY